MMRHREQEDLRRHPEGFKPNYMDNVSTAGLNTTKLSEADPSPYPHTPECNQKSVKRNSEIKVYFFVPLCLPQQTFVRNTSLFHAVV